MTTTIAYGRLGNQMIQNLAVSMIAARFNLRVNYVNHDKMEKLGIRLFSGEKIHHDRVSLTDDNYFSIYHADRFDHNLEPNHNFFQTRPHH